MRPNGYHRMPRSSAETGTRFRNRHLHNYITAVVNRSISLDRKHTGAQLLAAVRTSRHQYTSQWAGVMSGLAD